MSFSTYFIAEATPTKLLSGFFHLPEQIVQDGTVLFLDTIVINSINVLKGCSYSLNKHIKYQLTNQHCAVSFFCLST